jgi:formate dehydrogenase subunit beta
MSKPHDERTKKVREIVKKAIDDKMVQYFIGYQDGTYCGRDQPVFVEKPQDVDKLKWGPGCTHNLAVYIMDNKRKPLKKGEVPDKRPIGMIVKGCDTMGLVEFLKERIIDRNEVFLVAIECDGIVDQGKLEARLKNEKIPAKALLDIKLHVDGDKLVVEYGKEKLKIPFSDIMLDKCAVCDRKVPLLHDVIITKDGDVQEGREDTPKIKEKRTKRTKQDKTDDYADIKAFEALSLEERGAYWDKEFGKCIRCYACRSSCPLCYCEQCVVDPANLSTRPNTSAEEKSRRPKWVERNNDMSETLFFHLVRAMHTAGRCIDCGECERACPMDIPLRKLTRKLRKDMKALFDQEAGTDPTEKPALATAREEDPQEFVR